MSEPIWSVVTVKVPRSWLASAEDALPFIDELADAMLNGSTDVAPCEDDDTAWIVQVDGEANYGISGDDEVQHVLDWLLSNRVPFEASDETKYECAGEWYAYDGNEAGTVRTGAQDANRGHVLDSMDWQLIADGNHPWAKSVEDYFYGTLHVHQTSVDHLPADAPSFDDEQVAS